MQLQLLSQFDPTSDDAAGHTFIVGLGARKSFIGCAFESHLGTPEVVLECLVCGLILQGTPLNPRKWAEDRSLMYELDKYSSQSNKASHLLVEIFNHRGDLRRTRQNCRHGASGNGLMPTKPVPMQNSSDTAFSAQYRPSFEVPLKECCTHGGTAQRFPAR